MQNKLFIVCPFSFMDGFIQEKYGKEVFFLSAPAGILHLKDYNYTLALREFLCNEKVQSIYLVNDVSCRFINNMIKHGRIFGLHSERVIEEIYIDHYFSHLKGSSLFKQQMKLAELNLQKQATELAASLVLGNYISDNGVAIKGLVTSKENNLIETINFQNPQEPIHEFQLTGR
jgi:hypothetical protein